jgi:hypothetical protein
MKDLLFGVLALAFAMPVQRIETERPDRATVKRVETAMNHLTVIEIAEPVVMAAAGSPTFKIERQGNKVLIQPIEEGASTNLFIWTASNRFSYELVPAASVDTMHFAIDQEATTHVQASPGSKANINPLKSGEDEVLRFGTPVRVLGTKSDFAPVGIRITDVFESNDQLTVRYTIENRTMRPYAMQAPQVFALQSPRSSTSLWVLRNTQIDSDLVKSIRSEGERAVPIMDSETSTEFVQSGERKAGFLSLRLGQRDSQPAVLRVIFSSGSSATPISIILVL